MHTLTYTHIHWLAHTDTHAYMLKMYLLVFSVRVTETGRDRDRPSAGSLLRVLQPPVLGQTKARGFTQVTYVGGCSFGIWTIFHCFPGSINRELACKWSNQHTASAYIECWHWRQAATLPIMPWHYPQRPYLFLTNACHYCLAYAQLETFLWT